MGTNTFDTEAMTDTARFLRQKSAEYTEIYTQLLNHANTMGAAWSTPDNLSFVEKINGCCKELKAMAEHLLTCAAVLETQASSFAATAAANQRGANSLT